MLADQVLAPTRDLAETLNHPLDRLAIHRYRASFRALGRIIAPRTRLPNMLRGTFEISYRQLVCHDVELDCRACPLLDACPYPPLFRPSPPPDAERLSRQQDLPRPFVFEPPPDARDEFAPGDRIDVGISLFGSANRSLPYFIVALRSLGERGLGPTRGRLYLERVTARLVGDERTVFDPATSTITPCDVSLRVQDLVRPGDTEARRVRIRFLTPTTLKRDGRLVERPAFADLVSRIRDRLSTLAAFFGDGPLDIDFAALGREAAAIRTVECRTSWQRRTRRSSRTGDLHETSGFTGEAVYEGDLGRWMPLLRFGEAIHVGKYAVWGNGWMAVETE